MSFSSHILLLLLCLVASAFFAGIEAGIVSINRLRLLHRSRNGSKAAILIEEFLRHPERLLGTTLVGGNISNVIFSTMMASLGTRYAGSIGQAAATLVAILAVLIFGEYLPKVWFASRPLSRSLRFVHLLKAVEWLLRPLTTLSLFLTNWTARQRGLQKHLSFVTREHLRDLTRASEAGGQISTFERLMISRVLDLQIKTASEIMTPLRDTVYAREGDSIGDVINTAAHRRHRKIPVLTSDLRNCLGIINLQDVLAQMPLQTNDSITAFIKAPFFIKDDVRADDVLPLLRHNRQRIAIVSDADKNILGIVTIENVMKILVGNLPLTTTGDRRAEPAPTILEAGVK